ncbi:DUF4905 domain-containing protein [Dyadobacter tibetensis]|uniref:DUF4905 domain-containing protein n=1 Tax=Dyadobacter tibetensis TaxID=1211851 RepID=UPI0018DE0AF0|nr:DUF4905 domain-containing protein [Dyadobacter tibetensis]
MQKHFNHRFSQQIWRVLAHPHPQRGEWVLELRDPATKTVSFAVLDTKLQKLRWELAPANSDWWTSLTAVAGEQVYCHDYRYPEIPEPTDLRSLSIEDGRSLWELPGYIMVQPLDDDWILVSGKQTGQHKYSYVQANTGAISPFKEQGSPKLVSEQLQTPRILKKGDAYFEQMFDFILHMSPNHRATRIEYMDSNPFMMFSYYIYEQEKLVQFLLVVNKNKDILLHEPISEPADALGQGTMLMKGKELVYLRYKNEFSSLTLI